MNARASARGADLCSPPTNKPAQSADGTIDVYFGPKSPGEGKNWLATIPGKGWLTHLPPLRTEEGVF
ncbi:DUF1214 domain-containing protein [Bradyrhizobium sp. Ash2021]|uniref:DUF1214 domain-containing protein n=1 Tax=Bradyrhizobium sp. Ash2021 TaxID=2954771 RepID=UPI0035C19161